MLNLPFEGPSSSVDNSIKLLGDLSPNLTSPLALPPELTWSEGPTSLELVKELMRFVSIFKAVFDSHYQALKTSRCSWDGA